MIHHNSFFSELLCTSCISVFLLIMIIGIIILVIFASNTNKKIKDLESALSNVKAELNSLRRKVDKRYYTDVEKETPLITRNKEESNIESTIINDEIEYKQEELSETIEVTDQKEDNTTESRIVSSEPEQEEFTKVSEESSQEKPEQAREKSVQKKPSFKFNFEAFFGGRILNIIGSIMLIIGIGFFLKYAFDNELISETFRVLLGGAIGGGLILGGSYAYKKQYSAFAQGLIGTGISILYLSIYAAHNLYHLTSHPVAFLLMIATTILSFFLALRYDAIAISFLGLIGGFLTPFLLASDSNNFTALLAYITFLNISVFTVVIKKDNWRSLELFALLATYLTFFPVALYYSGEPHSIKTAFLILTVLIYTGTDFSRAFRGIKSSRFLEYLTPALSALFFYIGILFVLSESNETLAGSIIMGAALVYIGLNIFLAKKGLLNQSFDKKTIITSIIYIILATGILFKGFDIVILWSIEALLALVIGVISNRSYIWKTSLAIYLIIPFKLLFTENAFGYIDIQDYSPILNLRTLAYMTFIGSLVSGIHFIKREESSSKEIIIPIFRYFWCAVLFILLNVELNDYYRSLTDSANNAALEYTQSIIRITMWALYSMPFIRFGIKKGISAFTVCGSIVLSIATLGMLIKGFSFTPIESFIPILNIRFIAFAIIISSLLLINKWLEGTKPIAIAFIRYCWCIITFILLNIELTDTFKLIAISYNSESLGFNLTMIRSALWTLYSVILVKQGLQKKINPYLISGSVLLSISVIYTLAKGYIFVPIESYEPLFNLRFSAFVIIIGGILLINKWLKDTNYEWKGFAQDFLKYFGSTFIFILLTSEINSYFSKQLFIAGGSLADSINYSKYLSFDLFWCLYSLPLIWLGIKRKITPFFILGLITLALGLITSLILSSTYPSLTSFSLIFNYRFVTLLILIGVLIAVHNLFKDSIKENNNFKIVVNIFKVLICCFIFLMATAEVSTFFAHEMLENPETDINTPINILKNQKQFAISAIWMFYSIILIIWGIYKRSKVVRITSMILFSITILKIFIIDLAFLDHLYRILSFVGMGAILLFASYLYQKYKDIILEPEKY